MQPRLSVIVPAHDAAATLGRCLAAIEDNGFARRDLEIVVVDDASGDASFTIAAEYADALIRLPDVPRGPAYARNRGAEVAHGQVLLFVDADVVLPRGTLARVVAHLEAYPETSAVVGRYAVDVAASSLPSAYRDARYHFLYAPAGTVATFWGACGAVRARALEEVGRFNEWHFSAPPAEDVELGRRLDARGHRVEVLADVEVKHLHDSSLRALLGRDCWHRGLRVARLLGDATLRPRASVVAGARSPFPVEPAVLGVTVVAALVAAMVGGLAPVVLAVAAALVLALELSFLAHLVRTLGLVRTIVVLPLHLACELVSGAGLMTGWALAHLVGAPRPHPTVEALAEIGVRTWPPLPTRR